MRTTVSTGSQPRHVALIERLASVSGAVYACMEVQMSGHPSGVMSEN